MSSCHRFQCAGFRVRDVLVGNQMITVDAEPHPAGIYAVYAIRDIYYGYRIGRGQRLRDASHTRHRLHIHREGA